MNRWGDFGGACLIGACDTSPDLFMPDGQAQGLVKSSSHLLGTFRTADGAIHRFLRSIQPYHSTGCFVFSNRGQHQLVRLSEKEETLYRGNVATRCDGTSVTFAPTGDAPFRHRFDGNNAAWTEGELLNAHGVRAAPATQWYNPWRDGGGGLAVTVNFRATATVSGEPAQGFFAHEVHYFPRGRDFMDSPYGWGGREVHWGHMATAFEDGSQISASLAFGPDGWGFALLFDEQGKLHASTDVAGEAELRSNGYPQRITYRFLGQTWVWEIEPAGERATTHASGIIGAEGVLRRIGDTRRVTAAMGTIDWWLDGRAEPYIVQPLQ
jgi:hypothetical protein